MNRLVLFFIFIVILATYITIQFEYILVKLQNIPDPIYETYMAHKDKYGNDFDEGYYSLRRCRYDNVSILEVQGGYGLGWGVFNFFDEDGNNICNFHWIIDNCAQHGCNFTCPKTDNCKVIAGNVDFEKDYVITYKTFE